MKHEEVLTANRLEAGLAAQELKEHSKLWRTAEGRFGWRGVASVLSPLLLISVGVVLCIQDGSLSRLFRQFDGVWMALLGFGLLTFNLWTNTQEQLRATRELLKRLERTRS